MREVSNNLFEGKVTDTEYYETARGQVFMLAWVAGVPKPLAIPQTYPRLPHKGDHVSAEGVTEGNEWFFMGHRDLVIGSEPEPVWTPKQKFSSKDRQSAYGLILNFAKGHPCEKVDEGQRCAECGEVMGAKFGTVNADDVAESLLAMFPDRNPHINGAFFLGLTKRGLLHPFGLTPTKRSHCHASKIPVYHLTEKGMKEAEKLL